MLFEPALKVCGVACVVAVITRIKDVDKMGIYFWIFKSQTMTMMGQMPF